MSKLPQFARPPFSQALSAWSKFLAERRLPADVLWIYDENLCFEKAAGGKEGFRLGFQDQFTPPPPEAERIAFDYFCDFEARLVFYRIGTARGKSVCLMLCDGWFESKGEKEGFVRQDEWLISFYPGTAGDVEEITDSQRWKDRILRDRPLHDLDFCMTLRSVHEILAHGRVLTSYEHYALKFLHAWKRLLTHSE
jgi:hypothetical protein